MDRETTGKENEIKLKRCPFCGGSAYLSEVSGAVACTNCEALLAAESPSESIDHWNRRIELVTVFDRLEALLGKGCTLRQHEDGSWVLLSPIESQGALATGETLSALCVEILRRGIHPD